MNHPATCFSETLVEPVRIVNVLDVSSDAGHRISPHEVLNEQQLQDALGEFTEHRKNGCQIIYICQTNSYQPLQITQSMMALISQTYHLSPELARLQSCFYLRNKDLEETVSVPLTESQTGDRYEVSYSMRYPEYKADYETWAIRQTGCFHLMDTETSSDVFIVFEPTPKSKLQEEIQAHLEAHANQASEDFLSLHRIFYQTYVPAWRNYILSIENRLLPLVGKSFANYIDQALLVGHADLGTLYKLKNKLHQASSILANSSALFSDIRSLLERLPCSSKVAGGSLSTELRNRERECTSYVRTANSMQERAQANIEFLSTTVMLRDQVVSKEQNGIMMKQNDNMMEQNRNMIQLNKSAVFITAVTLVYLPSSWLATFFGMNFFDLDPETHRIVTSSMIWIYVIASVALTCATFVLYYFLLQRDGRLFTRLVPTVRMPQRASQWSNLKKQFVHRQAVELKVEASQV
ncbi:hypothetical protein PVAG01_10534 [Phlyctema vagabunda]|uniref:CorA-like transporter domain-containing protein n=1 Tax=Phlyctema vagabunda TaxID=108571 RepID=A0ABR4P2J5_9HELO